MSRALDVLEALDPDDRLEQDRDEAVTASPVPGCPGLYIYARPGPGRHDTTVVHLGPALA